MLQGNFQIHSHKRMWKVCESKNSG